MENREEMFCPLMREMCSGGWTPSMDKGRKKGSKPPKCRWWIGVAGKNPQTGVAEDRHDCAIAWQPTIALEVARVDFSLGGAVESLRNRVNDFAQGVGSLAQALPMLSRPPAIDVNATAQEKLPAPEKTGENTDSGNP